MDKEFSYSGKAADGESTSTYTALLRETTPNYQEEGDRYQKRAAGLISDMQFPDGGGELGRSILDRVSPILVEGLKNPEVNMRNLVTALVMIRDAFSRVLHERGEGEAAKFVSKLPFFLKRETENQCFTDPVPTMNKLKKALESLVGEHETMLATTNLIREVEGYEMDNF